MDHDEYWRGVKLAAHARLDNLFSSVDGGICSVAGSARGVETVEHAKRVLAFALRHADDCDEKACAILSACELVHAMHELHEASV